MMDEFRASIMAPPEGSATRCSLFSPGSPRARFPCFTDTMEHSDFLGPFRRASLSFAWRYHVSRSPFRSSQPERWLKAGSSVSRSPQPASARGGVRTSQVPGDSLCAYALFSDPGGTDTSGRREVPTRPPLRKRRRLPTTMRISGLHSTALALAVYASPGVLTQRLLHRTQDSLPVASQALRGGIDYPQDSYGRFREWICPPSPSFLGAIPLLCPVQPLRSHDPPITEPRRGTLRQGKSGKGGSHVGCIVKPFVGTLRVAIPSRRAGRQREASLASVRGDPAGEA